MDGGARRGDVGFLGCGERDNVEHSQLVGLREKSLTLGDD